MQRYLYWATGGSLAVTYITVAVTMHACLRLWLGLATDMVTRQTIAVGLGVLVVTTPLWWLHWRWLHWQLTDADPAAVNGFRTYLLSVAVVTLFLIFGSAGLAVSVLARLSLGILADSTAGWGQSLLAMAAMVVATGIWYVHWRYLQWPDHASASRLRL